MNVKRVLAATVLVLLAAATAQAIVTQTPYQIHAGGLYNHLPSPEGPGISGGAPSQYNLGFGISGTFTYELDTAGPTARLLDLHLALTGNEAIQAAPPDFAPVTANRVEAWLASHTFVTDFIGGHLHLKSSITEGLKLTDDRDGVIAITGGFNHTPADGDCHALPIRRRPCSRAGQRDTTRDGRRVAAAETAMRQRRLGDTVESAAALAQSARGA